MVKFIPLTCEKCGGDLNVKEGLKYVTCNHCKTKFQVVQEKNATFLETVSVTVRTKIEQETCEIMWEDKKGFLGFGNSVRLWGKAIGKNGKFTAGITPFMDGGGANVSVHECLVLILTKSGWQHTGQGDPWFNTTFIRTPLDESSESARYKLEAEFGKDLLQFLYEGNKYYWVDKYLVEMGVLKKHSDSQRPIYDVFKAMYSLNSEQLKDIFDITKEDSNSAAFKTFVNKRKEIEELSG